MPLLSPKLKIPKAARERVQSRLLDDLEEAIRLSSPRNERLFEYDDQLRGNPFWGGLRPRWRGGSDVVDPLTRKHHLGSTARVVAVMRQDDWWIVNPTTPKDMAASGQLEKWLNDKVAQYNLATVHLYDLAYNAGRHSYAWLYCGWHQKYETVWETVYIDRATGRVVPEDYLLPGVKYEEREIASEELLEEGLDLRVPHTSDVIMWPPTCQDPDLAHWIAVREEYTAAQLVDMIDDIDLDADVVYEMIGSGSRTGQRDTTGYQARRDADEDIGDPGEIFTCWVVTGRPPMIIENGRPILKTNDRRRDYVFIACPDRGAVLKFAPCPYRARPWIKFPFIPEPGRLEGDSVCSLVMGLQREATIAMRARGDLRDLTMAPTLMVPEDQYDDLQRFSIFAGAMIPYSKTAGPQGIYPLQQDKSGFEAAFADGNDFRMLGGELFSAQAMDVQPQGQPVTATQAQMTAGGADDKFDMILTGMHRGISQLAKVIVSHYRQFMPPEGEEVVVAGQVLQMTPDVLTKCFRIAANGSSEMADTAIRLERLRMLYEAMMQNPILMQQMQMGNMTGIWALTAQLLRATGAIRDPQTIIGQEPTPPPNAEMIVQQMTQAIMAFAQQGDPASQQLLQMLQQMMASQPGDTGAGAGPPMSGGANPYASGYSPMGGMEGMIPGMGGTGQDVGAMMAGMGQMIPGGQGGAMNGFASQQMAGAMGGY